MGDFSQIGAVRTLHDLGSRTSDDLERELTGWTANTPLALVIPTLYGELERPPLRAMVQQLAVVPYLAEVIVGLDGANAEQFAAAKSFFADLPIRHRVLWHDGPRLREIDAELAKLGLAPLQRGKGRNVWYCLGYFLASQRSDVVAFHDADISTYSSSMLARLLYPLAHPDFDYHFAKGYYHRSDETTLNGRVTRLLVAPLIQAMRTTLGSSETLDYLAGFRYPLAGEIAISRSAAGDLRVPHDWGVEIGVLDDVFRRLGPARICQVDIAGRYDHKHQPLSADDPSDGLHKMAIDVVKALLRQVAEDGLLLDGARTSSIAAAYRRRALDLVEIYQHDALINGLTTDRHLEEETVEVFASAIGEAGDAYLSEPVNVPITPSWRRVQAAWPEGFDRLLGAVEADA